MLRCPRCGSEKSWRLGDGRRRCAGCRFDWRPDRLPLRLTKPAWQAVLEWFVRGAPSAQIAKETGLDRKRVLRALTAVREAIVRSAADRARPAETLRAEITTATDAVARASRRASRFPLIGLYLEHRLVGADVIGYVEAAEVGRLLRRRDRRTAVLPAEWQRYGAVVYRGRFYRSSGPADPSAFGGLEAFWAYLQRLLRAKGGIRRERLHLYLGEYVWRYNRRQAAPVAQVRELLELIRERRPGGSNRTMPRRGRGPARQGLYRPGNCI
jgi:transposase